MEKKIEQALRLLAMDIREYMSQEKWVTDAKRILYPIIFSDQDAKVKPIGNKMEELTKENLLEGLTYVKDKFNENGYYYKLLTEVRKRLESLPMDAKAKPAFDRLTVIERKELECIWNGKTNYGKHPMTYQRFLEAGLEIIIGCTNASQKPF